MKQPAAKSTELIDLPEADRAPGAPHPREVFALFGQEAAEAEFLQAYRSGRLHHGLLLTGPKGVGKATFAWRIARFLLNEDAAQGFGFGAADEGLGLGPELSISRRIAALSEPRLFLLRRPWDDKRKALRSVITVDEVRRLKSFFTLSAADGGRRVAIIDSADEMNTEAANALLKLLEEPPERSTILLVSHQPARLLPTIRSRCRELRLQPLGAQAIGLALAEAGIHEDDTQALAELASGSVGEAIRLINLEGLSHYRALLDLLSGMPRMNRLAAATLAEKGATRDEGGEMFELILGLVDRFLARLARAAALRVTPPEATEGEAGLITRLAPDENAARLWADLAQNLTARARAGKAVNLDPAALLVDMFLAIDETAAKLAAR